MKIHVDAFLDEGREDAVAFSPHIIGGGFGRLYVEAFAMTYGVLQHGIGIPDPVHALVEVSADDVEGGGFLIQHRVFGVDAGRLNVV